MSSKSDGVFLSVRATRPRRGYLTVAACFALLMLPNVFSLWYGRVPMEWVNVFLIPLALLLAVFGVLGERLWLACLLLLPFVVLAPLEAFYIGTYHVPSSTEILATLFASNLRETREYIGDAAAPLLACIAGSTLLGTLAVWWCWRFRLRWRHESRSWALVIIFATPTIGMLFAFVTASGGVRDRLLAASGLVSPLWDRIELGYPFGIPYRLVEYRRQWNDLLAAGARLEGFRFHATPVSRVSDRQTYVLVIGESSRRNHWQLFGYERATNAELVPIRNLIPITDMVSSWSYSIQAIPMIVTRKPESVDNLSWNEASVLRALNEAGFDTYWISNQLAIEGPGSPVSEFALEAKHQTFLNHASYWSPGSYDEDLLVPLTQALSESTSDTFIVLHMMGSHYNYDYRYPPPFARFRPTYTESDSSVSIIERTQNSYDNTIAYTDHVLASIIRILEARHEISALWYESDHGEDLSTKDCSLNGHGNGTSYDFQIPAFVWYSEDYGLAFPQRIAALRSNADRRTTSAVTFESLVDMTGIDLHGHDESMSLFSTSWRPRTRIVHGLWGPVDIDHALISKSCAMALPPS